MSPHTFIFMGRSGCGKGTQAKLLKEYIESHDDEKRGVLYVETGDRFREFISHTGFSSRLASEINKTGGLQPAFLAVWNWSHVLIDELKGEEHLMLDGTPRGFQEALVFDTAMTFYGRVKPIVVYVDVSREWSSERLHERASKEGRVDDQHAEQIEKRQNWFDTDIMPAIDYFKLNERYQSVRVNGEQPIEKVQADILAALGWNG